MDIPWYGWIAIIGVVAWAAIVIIGSLGYARRRGGGAGSNDVARQNVADHQAVLARLDSLDARLATVEKTLNDIP